jgi:hypothetical protein
MRRLTQAPNLALATLWRDMLAGAGIDCHVQRAYASGIVGQIPPDQGLPEVWVDDAAQHGAALTLLATLRNPPLRRWVCRGCDELVEGPFEQCWNCGENRPD